MRRRTVWIKRFFIVGFDWVVVSDDVVVVFLAGAVVVCDVV